MFEYEAVLFDLDGTLVDSMGIWKGIDMEYLGKRGIAVPDGLQKAIEGISMYETADYFKERFRIPDSHERMIREWNAMALEKYRQVPLKKGVLRYLRHLRSRNIPCGLATSNSRELVTAVAQARGIDGVFSCIMTGCDVGKGKPAPDIYLAVAKELEVDPESCLVFEDIVPGILAGKAAGMRVCAVEDAYSMPQKKEKMRLADGYIRDYRELWKGKERSI